MLTDLSLILLMTTFEIIGVTTLIFVRSNSLHVLQRATSDLSDQSNPSAASSSTTHRHGRQRGRSIQRPPSPTTRDLSSSTAAAVASVSQKPGPFLLGSATSFKKLSNFFGAEPPRVQNLKSFLEDLGYIELLPVSWYNEENSYL